MHQSFAQKVIAVTGAASGIGKATAKLLASRGALLSLCDINPTGLEQVAKEITEEGGKAIYTVVDISNDRQVSEWIAKTVEHYGKLHGAANVAGVAPKRFGLDRVEEMDEDDWAFTLGVNLTGLMHCLRAETKALSHPAAIVNTSSVMGLTGMSKNAAYCASKHAVIGLTKSAARELGSRGSRVNVVAPLVNVSRRTTII